MRMGSLPYCSKVLHARRYGDGPTLHFDGAEAGQKFMPFNLRMFVFRHRYIDPPRGSSQV